MKNLIAVSTKTMSSLEISKLTGSRHDNVRTAIERLVSIGVIQLPFKKDVKNAKGQSVKTYLLEKRDSYVVVAQLSPEFTGALVDRWQLLESREQSKLADKQLRSELQVEYRPMMDAKVISLEGKQPKFYDFSNEADLINRIVFGCSSAKFKVENDISKTDALRDFLTIEQKNALISLQRANAVYLLEGISYDDRKARLTTLYDRQHSDKLIAEHMRLSA